MDTQSLVSAYLTLAGMLATLVTLIVAGLIAIFQITDRQIPKRSLNSVISLPLQLLFIVYTTLLLGTAMLSAWLLSTDHDVLPADMNSNEIVVNAVFVMMMMLATITSYGLFIYILFRSRILFDNEKYVKLAASKFRTEQFANYLFTQYSTPPYNFGYTILTYLGGNKDEKEVERDRLKKEAQFNADKKEYELKSKKLEGTKNPLGELFHYSLRAQASDEIESVIMPLITEKLVEFIDSGAELSYLNDYMQEVTATMLASSSGSPDAATKKAYIDMIVAVSVAAVKRGEFDLAANVAGQLHVVSRNDKNDFLRQYALKAVDQVTSEYNEATKDVIDERQYMEPYEKLTLVVARMAENYYHNLDRLSPVAIVESNHHETESFSSTLVNYFSPFRALHERFDGAFPVIYFDSVDLSAEAFAGAIARSGAISSDIGASRYSYSEELNSLYYIFYDYAKHGMENEHHEVVYNCIFRMRRGIEFLSKLGLKDATFALGDYLYSIGVMIAATPGNITFGEFRASKDEVLVDIAAAINKCVIDMDEFQSRKSSMDHSLFDYIYKKGAKGFVSMIDWGRGDLG